MTIRALESLIAIADQGSITAAAESVFLSVPAVSAQIAGLEAAIKAQLLDRRHKPARLNPTGVQLSERARDVVARYHKLYEPVSQTAELAGTLVLGASPTVMSSTIPRMLVWLRKAHPGIQVRMRYGRAWSLLKDLQHGEIDALIISKPQSGAGDARWTAFAKEPVVVIAPPEAKGRTDEALLAEYPYIRFGKRFWVGDTIASHLASRAIVPNQIMEVDSREAIAMMVRHGLGVSIVPQSDPSLGALYGIREVPLGKPGVTREIGLAQSPGNPKQPLVDALMRGLKEATRNGGRAAQ